MTSSATGSPTIPATVPGKQLSWLLTATASLPIAASELKQHFGKALVQQMPASKLNPILAELSPPGGMSLTSITTSTPTALLGIVETTQGPLRVSVSTQSDGLINGLWFKPTASPTTSTVAAPTSWHEIDRRLAAVAPHVGMITARIGHDGHCTTIHAVHPTTARPLGSMFKLYVLGALATKIESGALSWDQKLTIHDNTKSLPSGVLQNRPAGTTVTVRQAAEKMISISDNTAADLLARAVGRSAVGHAQQAMGSSHAQRNVPFLRTREMFVLKGVDYPKYMDGYLAQGPSSRLDYLTSTVDKASLTGFSNWQQPRDIDRVEWFASPEDLCDAFATLHRMAGTAGLKPISTIMTTNDGGLDLDASRWPTVYFKGGSEPGVLTTGWLATAADGDTFVTVLMAEDPNQALDETTAERTLLALARGAFALAA